MGSYPTFEAYLNDVLKKMELQMPKIREEIRIYEQKAKDGQLNTNPIPAPQFNGQA